MLCQQMGKEMVLYNLFKNKSGNVPKGCINVDALHGKVLVSDKARELQLFWLTVSSVSAIDDLFV